MQTQKCTQSSSRDVWSHLVSSQSLVCNYLMISSSTDSFNAKPRIRVPPPKGASFPTHWDVFFYFNSIHWPHLALSAPPAQTQTYKSNAWLSPHNHYAVSLHCNTHPQGMFVVNGDCALGRAGWRKLAVLVGNSSHMRSLVSHRGGDGDCSHSKKVQDASLKTPLTWLVGSVSYHAKQHCTVNINRYEKMCANAPIQ